MDSIRQQQVAKQVQVALSDIFRSEASEILEGAMVTVSTVRMTPDLLTARCYLGIFNTPKPEEILGYIHINNKELRRLLGNKLKNKVRRIPEIHFYRDDTLDEVFKLEKIFSDIHKQDEKIEAIRKSSNFVDENPYRDDVDMED